MLFSIDLPCLVSAHVNTCFKRKHTDACTHTNTHTHTHRGGIHTCLQGLRAAHRSPLEVVTCASPHESLLKHETYLHGCYSHSTLTTNLSTPHIHTNTYTHIHPPLPLLPFFPFS